MHSDITGTLFFSTFFFVQEFFLVTWARQELGLRDKFFFLLLGSLEVDC